MAYTHPAADPDAAAGEYGSSDYHIGQDADTLKKHSDITADPKRHAAAHAKLAEQTQSHSSALDASHKAMHQKVKKGLKQAFPSNLNKPTPFQSDSGKTQGSPFQEAEQKE